MDSHARNFGLKRHYQSTKLDWIMRSGTYDRCGTPGDCPGNDALVSVLQLGEQPCSVASIHTFGTFPPQVQFQIEPPQAAWLGLNHNLPIRALDL